MRYFGSCLVLLLLLACTTHSDHGSMQHAQITSEEVFIAEMIPHHQEAVESSRLMLSSENEQVRALAQRIIAAQEQEIAMMQQWMQEWYPESTYHSAYQPMMGDLVHESGRDDAYLNRMIAHHEAAIEMAKQAQELELRPEVQQLTEAIITTQEAEIAEMRELESTLRRS